VYLGADLPAAEIAQAVRACGAQAVALSVAAASPDGRVARELADLRSLVGPDLALFVGGSAVSLHSESIRHAGAIPVSDLGQFQDALDRVAR
jgi:hypothetical protein